MYSQEQTCIGSSEEARHCNSCLQKYDDGIHECPWFDYLTLRKQSPFQKSRLLECVTVLRDRYIVCQVIVPHCW